MTVQNYYEDITIYNKININNAYGTDTHYIKEKTIRGAIGTLNSNELLIAEANGIKPKYIITIDKTDSLPYGTIIKREKNTQFYRITSNQNDMIPPDISTFDWKQVYAELYEMPQEVI